MKQKLKSCSLTIVIFVFIIIGIRAYMHRPIQLPLSYPNTITISIYPQYKSDETPFAQTVTDKNKINEFIDFLKNVRKNTDHKCGDRGSITLDYGNAIEKITFLPGHNEKFYEIRYKRDNFRLTRNIFIEKFENMGIPSEKIPLGH